MDLLKSLLFMLNEMSPYILLGFLIAGLMHAFIPQSAFARHLSGTGAKSVIKAAAIGIPLPLCSCGVLPTAIAMRRSGASKAASTSFLVATPQTGVDSIAATWSLLGPAFAVIRPLAALVTALFGGLAVGKSESRDKASRHSSDNEAEHDGKNVNEMQREECAYTSSSSFGRKCVSALKYGYVDLVASIGGWLVVGLLIAAVITVYVPADTFALFGSHPLFAMIAVLVVAIPMYVCATGSIPIALSLMLKGLSPGTALVLLMAGPAANFASFTLISREMGRKAAFIYLSAIIVGAISFGLIIDYLLPASWFDVVSMHGAGCHDATPDSFSTICSAIVVGLLMIALVRGHKHNHVAATADTRQYRIKGMRCSHCQATVTKSIAGVDGVEGVEINLSTGVATVSGSHDVKAVIAAVRGAGFDVDEQEGEY